MDMNTLHVETHARRINIVVERAKENKKPGIM